MNEQDFMLLLNQVAKIAKPFNDGYTNASSMSDQLADLGLDSLDMLLTGVYLCDIFKIDEETGKALRPMTVQELYDFLMANKTHTPTSVEDAMKEVQ